MGTLTAALRKLQGGAQGRLSLSDWSYRQYIDDHSPEDRLVAPDLAFDAWRELTFVLGLTEKAKRMLPLRFDDRRKLKVWCMGWRAPPARAGGAQQERHLHDEQGQC